METQGAVAVWLTPDDLAMLATAGQLLEDNSLTSFANAVFNVLHRAGYGQASHAPSPDKEARYAEVTEGRKHLPTNVWFNGERLKLWLHRNDTTQKTLAQRVGVHETTLGGWIAGHARPSIEVLEKLSEVTETMPCYWVDIK